VGGRRGGEFAVECVGQQLDVVAHGIQVLLFPEDSGRMEGSKDSEAVHKTEDICLALVVEAMAEGHGLAEQVLGDGGVCVGTEAEEVHDVVGVAGGDGLEVVVSVPPTGVVMALLGLLVVAKGWTTGGVGEVNGVRQDVGVVEVDVGEQVARGSGEATVRCVLFDIGVHAHHNEWCETRAGVRLLEEACRYPGVLGCCMEVAAFAGWVRGKLR